MKISIITLFPNMFKGFLEESIIKRAQEKKIVEIEFVNLRDFAKDSYGSVDDKPYGGGAGMVMRVDVIKEALDSVIASKARQSKKKEIASSSTTPRNDTWVVLTSAKGKQFNQKKAKEFSQLKHLVILAGHYEGVDERVTDFVDEEVSIGDFVMTGGELTAAMIIDAVVRLLPGVLKKEKASQEESFFTVEVEQLKKIVGETDVLKKLTNKKIKVVQLLEYPHYTRPEEFAGKKVPEELLSGNHKKIEEWRIKKAYEETLKKRPDLLS